MRYTRQTSTTITALAALFALSACGEGSAFDDSFKAEFREKVVANCAGGLKNKAPPGYNIDVEKLCGCTADKLMAGKSASDLMNAGDDPKTEIAAVQKCLGEQHPDLLQHIS